MIMLIFGVLLVLVPLGQLSASSDVLPLSVIAEVVMVGVLLLTAWRDEHVTPWEAPATAALTTLVGLSLQDPTAVGGICIGVILTQTLYDGRLNALWRLLSFLPVVPLVAGLSATGLKVDHAWNSQAVLAVVPTIPLFIGLVTMLRGALLSQAESITRERFLRSLTSQFLAASLPGAVADVCRYATDDLCRVAPGLSAVAVYRIPPGQPNAGSARFFHLHGAAGDHTPDWIPADVLAPLEDVAQDLFMEIPGATNAMAALGLPPGRIWLAQPDALPTDIAERVGMNTILWGIPLTFSERYLRIPGPRGREIVELLRTFREHGYTAFSAAFERMTLLNESRTDAVTGLANRPTFIAELRDLAARGAVSLLLVQTSGLSRIAIRHGIANMDAAMAQLAQRLAAITKNGALLGRIGDEVLCVAASGPDQRAQLAEMIPQVREQLAEPVTMPSGQESLTVSVGHGQLGPGDNAVDLIEQAASALHADLARTARRA